MGSVKIISSSEFEDKVLNSDGVVVVDFFADWCGPCKMYGPIFEQTASKLKDQASFYKVNVDESSDIAAKFGIRSIPTTVIFKKGVVVEMQPGLLSEDQLTSLISNNK